MLGFLIFYYFFSAVFSMSTVDETEYMTKGGFYAAAIAYFVLGPIMLPVILGVTIGEIYKK